MNSDLSFAIQHGWKIFPLLNHSSLAPEQPLLLHATAEETQIERWESEYPESAWAVATGSESGVMVLRFELDMGSTSARDFGERDFSLSSTLQVQDQGEIFTFLEWPAGGLPPWTPSVIAPDVRLVEEGGYVRIPGPGMSDRRLCQYLDREARILPPSEWLMELIQSTSTMRGPARILPFRPSRDVAQCVLLSFEQRGSRWYCDFYEASGTAKVRETLCYGSSSKVVSLAIRGGAFLKRNGRTRLYEGIQVGYGRIPLQLTSDQFEKLIAA